MVDVIHIDEYGREVGYLNFAQGDFDIGVHNSFELIAPADEDIEQNHFVAIEDSEYGGSVDDIEIDTSQKYITIYGRTWHGILESNPVIPDKGQSHLVLAGECNEVLQQLIDRLNLGFCMVADTANSGFVISGYTVPRIAKDMNGYAVARNALLSAGAKLRIRYDGSLRRAVLSAVKRMDYTDNGIDGDQNDFIIKKSRVVNHLHCMGTGQGVNRVTVDLYANDKGEVSHTQTLFGIKHKCEIYESPNSDLDDLTEQGAKHLKDFQANLFTCSLINDNEEQYDIDDIVGGRSTTHNVSVVTTIAEKIASIGKNNKPTYQTKTATEV